MFKYFKFMLVLSLISSFIFSYAPQGFAATDEEIEALKVQVGELMQRIEKLETEQAQAKTEVIKAKEQHMAPEGLESRVVKLEEDIKKVPKIANFLKGDMKIGGYIQTRYTSGPSKKVDDTITISNAKITFSGHVVPEVGYKLELGPHQTNGRILYDALMSVAYFPKAKVTIGQFKVPFSEEFITSSSNIRTAERALFQGTLSNEYSQGLMVEGDILDNLYYAVAGVTGQDRTPTTSDNQAKDVIGRLVYSPFKSSDNELIKGFSLGSAVQYGRQPRSGNNEGGRLRNLGMLQYNYRGFTFLSEYVHQEHEQIPTRDDLGSQGWYALIAYKFPFITIADKHKTELEPVFKVEQYDPNTDTGNDRQDMYTLGLTWYLNKYVYIMGNYQFRDEQNENSDNRFILQSQVKF